MRGSLDFADIIRLLQDFVRLQKANRNYGHIVSELEKETQFPDLENYLRQELLDGHFSVEFVAEQLAFYQPVKPEVDQEELGFTDQVPKAEKIVKKSHSPRSGILAFFGAMLFITLLIFGVWLFAPTSEEWALSAIRQLDGGFHRDDQIPGKPVVSAILGRNCPNSGLIYLKPLRQLRLLSLHCPEVTDAGLVHLKGLNQLRDLSILYSQVGDQGLVHLKELPQLERLSLFDVSVTDSGLVHLNALQQLQDLAIFSKGVTDAGLIHIGKMTHLRRLRLAYCNVTDAGLAHLGQLTQLEHLDLQRTKVTNAGLEHLKSLTKLTMIDLRDTAVTLDGITALRKALPNLGYVPDRSWFKHDDRDD